MHFSIFVLPLLLDNFLWTASAEKGDIDKLHKIKKRSYLVSSFNSLDIKCCDKWTGQQGGFVCHAKPYGKIYCSYDAYCPNCKVAQSGIGGLDLYCNHEKIRRCYNANGYVECQGGFTGVKPSNGWAPNDDPNAHWTNNSYKKSPLELKCSSGGGFVCGCYGSWGITCYTTGQCRNCKITKPGGGKLDLWCNDGTNPNGNYRCQNSGNGDISCIG